MLVLAVALGLAGAAQPGAAWASSGCEVDTGGTCNVLWCDASRGATYCSRGPVDFKCLCRPGYCNQHGMCARDTSLPRMCDIDQSDRECFRFQECREAEECTGRLYGVCRCKNGFCKNEAGDCLASNVPLNVSFLPDSWESMSADEVEQVDGDGKRLVVAVGVALTCALAAVSAAVSFVAARRAWHRTAVSQPLLS